MTTTSVYDKLLAEIDEPLTRKVFEVLAENAGQQLTRPDLIFKVFGVYVQQAELTNNKYDRQIRECIAILRKRGYPIFSTSGEKGYTLTTDETKIDEYIAEQLSRLNDLQENVDAARQSKRRAADIRTWRETAEPPKQFTLFQ